MFSFMVSTTESREFIKATCKLVVILKIDQLPVRCEIKLEREKFNFFKKRKLVYRQYMNLRSLKY